MSEYSTTDRALADAYVAAVTETGVDGPSQDYALQTGAAMREWLRRRGFAIAYVSRCWCEGKATGNEHSPECAELAREERSKRPTTPA